MAAEGGGTVVVLGVGFIGVSACGDPSADWARADVVPEAAISKPARAMAESVRDCRMRPIHNSG